MYGGSLSLSVRAIFELKPKVDVALWGESVKNVDATFCEISLADWVN